MLNMVIVYYLTTSTIYQMNDEFTLQYNRF